MGVYQAENGELMPDCGFESRPVNILNHQMPVDLSKQVVETPLGPMTMAERQARTVHHMRSLVVATEFEHWPEGVEPSWFCFTD